MPSLSESENAKAKELFDLYDEDASGSVNTKELTILVRAFGFAPSKKQIDELIAKYDKNDDHKLAFAEFVTLLETEQLQPTPAQEELMAAFRVFDKDNSGAVTKDELKAALQSKGEPMSDEEVEKMMTKFDADGDGKLKYAEFAKMFSAEEAPKDKSAEEAPKAEKESVRSKINWDEISAKMPIVKNDEEKAKRKEMFGQFDPNGNGYLSLAECQKGIRDVLAIDEIFDVKPVIMRAFQAAKGAGNRKGKTSKHGPDFVEFREFRLFLVYLRAYFEVWQMFDEVDSGDDRRVNLEEFKAAVGKIASWGLKIDDVEAEFKAIDTNDGGIILFNEFADWALNKKLDLEDDDDEDTPPPPPASDAKNE